MKTKKITFVLKSGKEITFKCKNIEVGSRSNELMNYSIDFGRHPRCMLYCRIDEIAVIKMKDSWF